eukprot:COSAG01_NODE_277_length_19582_cov_28.126726_8_plen_78_part_00
MPRRRLRLAGFSGVSADELNRGVNAGVQLLNLTRMRAANLAQRFPEITARGIGKHMTLFGHLGDQDVRQMLASPVNN